MKTACLVTNYNYADYLEECLASVASQTRRFDRLIIVDDGSTDRSREIIAAFCQNVSYAVAVYKENGGQLSSFQAALEHIAPEDLVCFLDADDSYPCDYLEELTGILSEASADFIFVNPVRFQDRGERLETARIGDKASFDFASTSALTRKTLPWIGEVTSCVCVRGSLLHSLLPYPFEKDWVTRADDVLIFGASILGSHKLYVPSLGVNYRLHHSNRFTGRELSVEERADWRLRHERLRKWYSDKAGLPVKPPLKNALHEAALIPGALRKRFGIPSPALLFMYDILTVVPVARILCRDMVGARRS